VTSHDGDAERTGPAGPAERDDGRTGTPLGRRLVLGMLGVGAASVAAAPQLQRGLESFLGSAADKDPTGLTGLLPNGGGFRYYSNAPPPTRSPTCAPSRRPGSCATCSA
jgi:hypothetical protein